MGDQQRGAAEAFAEMLLEPLDRLDVDVVGRLVEDREIGLGDEHTRQGDPSPLPARQRFDAPFGVLDAEVVDDRLGLVHPLPAAEPFDLFRCGCLPLNEIVHVAASHVGQRLGQLVVVPLCGAPLDEVPEHYLPRGLAFREPRFLVEELDAPPASLGDRASVVRLATGENAAESALSATAQTDQADAFAAPDRQRDARENRAVAKRLEQLSAVDDRHEERG